MRPEGRGQSPIALALGGEDEVAEFLDRFHGDSIWPTRDVSCILDDTSSI